MESVVFLPHARSDSDYSFKVFELNLFYLVSGVKLLQLWVGVEQALVVFVKEFDTSKAAVLLVTLVIKVKHADLGYPGSLRLDKDLSNQTLIPHLLHLRLGAIREDEIVLMLTVEIPHSNNVSLVIELRWCWFLIILFPLSVREDVAGEPRDQDFLHKDWRELISLNLREAFKSPNLSFKYFWDFLKQFSFASFELVAGLLLQIDFRS